MEIKENKKLEGNKVELEIVVSAEEFEEAVQKAYNKNKNSITVPGFRKGKATRKMIEKMYGEGVFYEDAVNDTYGKAYDDAVAQSGIKPIENPSVEILSLDKNGYTFKATVTVEPEVTLSIYKGVEVTKDAVKVSAKEVNEELEKLRQKNARLVGVTDRAAQLEDTVVIDYSGSVNGDKFDGGTAEKQSLKLGSGQFIPGFEEQIVGKNIGDEFDVNVKFPEEYHAAELAGKDAVFAVKLHEIKVTELPVLDDEFVKDISADFDTLDAYKADLKKKLTASKEKAADAKVEDDIIDAIVDGMQVDLPQVLVERQLDELCNEFAYRLQSQGLDFKTYLQITGMSIESFRDGYKDIATKRAKVRLAVNKIAELEGFSASEEEIEAEYAKVAEGYSMDVKQVKAYIPAADIAADIVNGKAIDFVKANAVISAPAKKTAAKKADKAEEKAE